MIELEYEVGFYKPDGVSELVRTFSGGETKEAALDLAAQLAVDSGRRVRVHEFEDGNPICVFDSELQAEELRERLERRRRYEDKLRDLAEREALEREERLRDYDFGL